MLRSGLLRRVGMRVSAMLAGIPPVNFAVLCFASPALAGSVAARAGNVTRVNQCVQWTHINGSTRTNWLMDAIRSNHIRVVNALLDLPLRYGVNPAAEDNYALCCAAEYGHVEIVKLLLALPAERGINPAVNDNLPLHWASRNGHVEVVKLLLALPAEYGINPAVGDNFTLYQAICNGHTEVVKLLTRWARRRT